MGCSQSKDDAIERFLQNKTDDVDLDSEFEPELEDRVYVEESDYGEEEVPDFDPEPEVAPEIAPEPEVAPEPKIALRVPKEPSHEEPEVALKVQQQPSHDEPKVAFKVPKEPSHEEPEVAPAVQKRPIHEEQASICEWSSNEETTQRIIPETTPQAEQPHDAGTWVLEFEDEGLVPLPQKTVVVQHTEPDQIPLIELEENKDYPREEFEDVNLYTGRHVNGWEIDYEFVKAVNRIMTPGVTQPDETLSVRDTDLNVRESDALRRTQKSTTQTNFFMHEPHFGYYVYYPYPYNEIFGQGKKMRSVKPRPKPDTKLETKPDPIPDPKPLPHQVVEQRNVKVQVDLNPRPIQVPTAETRDGGSQTVVLEEPPKQYRNVIVQAEYQTNHVATPIVTSVEKRNFKVQCKLRPKPMMQPDDGPNVKIEPEPMQPDDGPDVNTDLESKEPDDGPDVKTELESKDSDDGPDVNTELESKEPDDGPDVKTEQEPTEIDDRADVKTEQEPTEIDDRADVKTEFEPKEPDYRLDVQTELEPKEPDDRPDVKTELKSKEPDDKPYVKTKPKPKKSDDRPKVKNEEKAASQKLVFGGHECPHCGKVCPGGKDVLNETKKPNKKYPDDLGTKELAMMFTSAFWKMPKRAEYVNNMEKEAKNFVVKNRYNKECKKMEAKIARDNLAEIIKLKDEKDKEAQKKTSDELPKAEVQALDAAGSTWKNCLKLVKNTEEKFQAIESQAQYIVKHSGAKGDKTRVKSKLSMCSKETSSTGWFCWCKDCTHSDINKEVGVGVSLYFKTMKQLIIFFAICSVLSFPQFFCLFKSDAQQRSTQFGADYMLGSLGWTQPLLVNTTKNTPGNFEMVLDCKKFDNNYAKFILQELLIVQVERKLFDAEKQFKNQLALGHKCNNAGELQNLFEQDCSGKSSCKLDLKKQLMTKCKKADDPRNAIFLKAICASDEVAFKTLGFTASRENITWTIVVFDMIICLYFVFNTFWLHYYIRHDIKYEQTQKIKFTDYVLKITNLPEAKSIEKLALMLEYDIRELIKEPELPDEQNKTNKACLTCFDSKHENNGKRSWWSFSKEKVKQVQPEENHLVSEAENSLIVHDPSNLQSYEQLLREQPVLQPKVQSFQDKSQLEGGSNELNGDSDAQNKPQRHHSASRIESDGSQLVKAQTRDPPNLSQLVLKGQADGGEEDLRDDELSEIVSIHIVQDDQTQLNQIKKLEEFGKRWKRLKAKEVQWRINEENNEPEKNEVSLFCQIYARIERNCCLFDGAFCYKNRSMNELAWEANKIDKAFANHVKQSKEKYQKIVCAYVTFRSIEARNRLYNKLHQSRTFLDHVTCKKMTKQEASFTFSAERYKPKAYKPEEPDMILWENLKFSNTNKTVRKILVLICAAIMLTAGMYINVLGIFTQDLVNSAQLYCDYRNITMSEWQLAQDLVAVKIAYNTQFRANASSETSGADEEEYDWYHYQSGTYDLDDIFISDFVNKLPKSISKTCNDTCAKKYKNPKDKDETLLKVLLKDDSCFSCTEYLNPKAVEKAKTYDMEILKEMGAFEKMNAFEKKFCIDCNIVVQEYMTDYMIKTEEEAVKEAREKQIEPSCQHYFRLYAWQSNFIYILPQIIQVFTAMSQKLWQGLTGFEKHRTKSGVDSSLTSNQFLVAYAIQGITIILVSMRISKENIKVVGLDFPFLRGTYSVYSLDWYRFVGTQIAVTLFTAIFYHHFMKSQEILRAAKAWWDRGFKRVTNKVNPTKKFIEEDYEDLHTGQPFELSKRYANILYMVGLVFLFSSGIAILYPIACLYFIVGYVVDKFMLVYISGRPLRYDGKLAKKTLEWFKWIIAGHFILGVFMYANGRIVTSELLQDLAGWGWVQTVFGNTSGNDFRRRHIVTFFWFAIALPSFYLLLIYHEKIKVCLQNLRNPKDEEKKPDKSRKDEYKNRDFYTFVNFETLVFELKDVAARQSAADKLIQALEAEQKPKAEDKVSKYNETLTEESQEQQKKEAGKEIKEEAKKEIDKINMMKLDMEKKKEAILKAMRTFKLKAYYRQLFTDFSWKIPSKEFDIDELLKDGKLPTDPREFKMLMKKLEYIRDPKKKKADETAVKFYETVQTYDMFKHPSYRRLEYYKTKLLLKIELTTGKAKDAVKEEAKELEEKPAAKMRKHKGRLASDRLLKDPAPGLR